jgi:hypothetical protein
MLSDKWETLADIAKRTGFRGEDVIEIIREKFAAGEVSCRFVESGGVKITEIRKKENAR